MSSSAITTQVAQLKAGSIQNQADSSSIYSAGVWSFKNSTAVASVTISDAGNVGVGKIPTFRLDVQGAVGENATLAGFFSGTNTTRGFTIGLSAGGGAVNDGYVVYNHTLGAGNSGHIWQAGGTERMRIDASGNLLVGTTSLASVSNSTNPSGGGITGIVASGDAGLYIKRTNSDGPIAYFARGGAGIVGYVNVTSSAATYVSSSDYRLKKDVQPMVAALSKVAALKPCTYKWKVDGSDGEGFIAHELAEVCPLAVAGEKDAVNEDGSINPQGIDPSKLVGLLVAAIQELEARLAALESK